MDTSIVVGSPYNSQRARAEKSMASSNGSSSFANILSTTVAEAASTALSKASKTHQADFTNMTRQEMFAWMNDQIQSGDMSLDESTPFFGMTIKMSVATGEPVNMDTDFARINFIEKAQQGIEGALSRKDQGLAERLQTAITMMQSEQGKKLGVDVSA